MTIPHAFRGISPESANSPQTDHPPGPAPMSKLVVTASQYMQSAAQRSRVTPDEVIRDEVEDMTGHADAEDRAVWSEADGRPARIVAVIRPGPDGVPRVTRFDGDPPPAPTIAPASGHGRAVAI